MDVSKIPPVLRNTVLELVLENVIPIALFLIISMGWYYLFWKPVDLYRVSTSLHIYITEQYVDHGIERLWSHVDLYMYYEYPLRTSPTMDSTTPVVTWKAAQGKTWSTKFAVGVTWVHCHRRTQMAGLLYSSRTNCGASKFANSAFLVFMDFSICSARFRTKKRKCILVF